MDRNRNINTSRESNSYKVDLKELQEGDDLTVNITKDKEPYETFHFRYEQLRGKDSIHFRFTGNDVIWHGGMTPDSKPKLSQNGPQR
ncbi:MAG: hypothetical protein NC344_03815 [Bacteroidales bacterium]|nr:hypothetical protein [Bacteroidales bacterium]MCM1146954.1 hypothetical protein [Bacteroidales bacterium]MCM1206999.1 hypothetical protein [Bacillota bacterium]MCM1511387.1 hypothetical protein [Clostridium sp.]